MKQSLFIFFLAIIVLPSFAQDNSNYLFKKGNKIEVTNHLWSGFKKFMEFPKIIIEVKDVKDSNGVEVAMLTKTSIQNKGKSQFVKDIKLTHGTDGMYYYDISFWLVDTILQKELVKAANVKTDTLFYFADGGPSAFPEKGVTGQQLPSYSYLLTETDVFEYMVEDHSRDKWNANQTNMTHDQNHFFTRKNRSDWTSRKVNFNSRKIEGIEKVTTPAGTWECYKVVNKDLNAKGMYKNIYIIEYYAPGFGLVKTENYYKNRKLSYSEISRIF